MISSDELRTMYSSASGVKKKFTKRRKRGRHVAIRKCRKK